MIHDVDESLRALVKRDALNGSGVEVAFDAPTKDWVARRNAPVVNLYLYDIREDLARRDTSWIDVRGDDGRVLERRLPPRRFRLSYLATAWTQRPEDEHRLLASMLAGFLQHEYFPAELLKGSLEGEETPVLLTVALPPADERKIADTWSALGGELKPSLDVVVTAPLNIARSIEAGPPVLEEPRLALVSTSPERGGEAPTGTKKRRAPGSAASTERPAAAEATPDAGDLPDETYTAGALTAPGRRIRLRQISGR
ncbi:MAG TPA: DUF4255 domain-containing protein [Candidatus Limnocylindrales bacterium]|nr:DUF4255 domain-containing protein [Candidatus Limnocylindrales bacterium]